MTDVNVLKFISEQKRTNKDCAAEWEEIESMYREKLWTELTAKIVTLIDHPSLQNEDSLVRIYQTFISSFVAKIDPHKLVDIVSVIVNFISNKSQAVQFLERVEDTVKVCSDAVWRCIVLKGEILLNKFNDLKATKNIIDKLSLVVGDANQVPVYWKMFLLSVSYHHRVLEQYENNCAQLDEKFTSDMDKLQKNNEKVNKENKNFNSEIRKFKHEIERITKENGNFNQMILSERENFDKKLLSVKKEIEAKFISEAVRNFEEVMISQGEISSLRTLNDRLLNVECTQLRNQNSSLQDNKTNLEATLQSIIAEQQQQKQAMQQQKQAMLLLGAHIDRLSLRNDDKESGPGNETPQ